MLFGAKWNNETTRFYVAYSPDFHPTLVKVYRRGSSLKTPAT